MRDRILALLTAPEPFRKVDDRTLKSIIRFFRGQFDVLLKSNVRLHPLGFFYGTESISDATTLRYHLWPTDWSMPKQEEGKEIHDHVYELNSLVLAGSMQHETFGLTPTKGGRHEMFRVIYTHEGSGLCTTGQMVELQASTQHIYSAGMAYRLEAGVLHRVHMLPIATLVLTIRQDAPASARVVVEQGKEIGAGFCRKYLTAQDIERARAALAHLAD